MSSDGSSSGPTALLVSISRIACLTLSTGGTPSSSTHAGHPLTWLSTPGPRFGGSVLSHHLAHRSRMSVGSRNRYLSSSMMRRSFPPPHPVPSCPSGSQLDCLRGVSIPAHKPLEESVHSAGQGVSRRPRRVGSCGAPRCCCRTFSLFCHATCISRCTSSLTHQPLRNILPLGLGAISAAVNVTAVFNAEATSSTLTASAISWRYCF